MPKPARPAASAVPAHPPRHDGAATGDFLGGPAGVVAAVLGAALFAAYLPALHGTLLWDDAGHVTRPELRTLAGLWRIWTEPGATQQFYPVLHSAFWLEHRLWGDATVGYHLTNLLQHGASAVLFGLLLRRLAVPGAWLAAALFALHPVAVESVAWISEQKNTLSTLLYLGAAHAFLKFDATRRPGAWAGALGLFAAALLSKSVTATLPAALLVVAWWRRGRIEWRRDVLPLLPWFALALAAGLHTAHVERTQIGAAGDAHALSFAERLLVAGRAPWFYLGKLLWPAELVFIYPRWELDAASPAQWLFPAATVAALGGLAWLALARGRRGPLAAALLFGGALFPALGFFNVFPFLYSFVADHFQYLAGFGPYALAAGGCARLAARGPRAAVTGGAFALLLTLGLLTHRQAAQYRDLETLYTTTIARNPACWMAHQNLAILRTGAGDFTGAIEHLETVLRLRPGHPEALSNLGDNLTRLGRPAEALPHLDRALAARPDFADARNNRAIALLLLGRRDEALAEFARTVAEHPDHLGARLNFSRALLESGRNAEAMPHLLHAVAREPANASAQLNLAIGLILSGRLDEALPRFAAAAELAPDNFDARFGHGRALLQAGRPTAALDELAAAAELRPEFAPARTELARALRQLGRTAEADEQAAAAAQLGAPRR